MILPRCLGVEVRERSGTEWLFIDVEYLRATVVRENSLSVSVVRDRIAVLVYAPQLLAQAMAALRGALLCIACTVAASSWPQWPDQPLSKGETVGVEGEHLAAPQVLQAHRKLAEVQAPSSEETALYHIIAWSSLMMVVVFFFASMALCNMQVESDSLLYSKAKAD